MKNIVLNNLSIKDYASQASMSQFINDARNPEEVFAVRPIGVSQNQLLAALSDYDVNLLLPYLELVELPFNTELHQYGAKITDIYFPTTAIIALLYTLDDGSSTEVGVIGREGVLGIASLMGDSSLTSAVVQSKGYAYKLKASILQELCKHSSTIQNLLMRYAHALFAQMTQNSVCGRHYSIEQQFSRWLLQRLDRLSVNEVKTTQELIASMLGVRRETITEVVGKLQHAGVIQCRRGYITVLDRECLEKNAGECYQATKREFDLVRF